MLSRRQILDKGKSGPGWVAGSVRCKIIGPKQNICQKWRFTLNFRCIFSEFVDSFWAGGNYERLLDEMCFDGQMCLASVL